MENRCLGPISPNVIGVFGPQGLISQSYRLSVFSNIAFYTNTAGGPADIIYTNFKRKKQAKSLVINLSSPLFSDLFHRWVRRARRDYFYFSSAVSAFSAVNVLLPLLRLFGFHLIISPKEFLPDANPFDMRMLGVVISSAVVKTVIARPKAEAHTCSLFLRRITKGKPRPSNKSVAGSGKRLFLLDPD